MKIVQIGLNRSVHGLFLKDSSTIELSYSNDNGITLKHDTKKYNYGYLSWPYCEFENIVGQLTCTLMSIGKAVNLSGNGGMYDDNIIEFRPCVKMIKLIKDLKSIVLSENTWKNITDKKFHILSAVV